MIRVFLLKQSDLGLLCLSRLFCWQLVFEISALFCKSIKSHLYEIKGLS